MRETVLLDLEARKVLSVAVILCNFHSVEIVSECETLEFPNGLSSPLISKLIFINYNTRCRFSW